MKKALPGLVPDRFLKANLKAFDKGYEHGLASRRQNERSGPVTRRAGVFVCHCGNNIAATVDVKQVAEELGKDEGVVFSKDYVYMCSDPGQQSIIDAIKEHKLDSVVISCCSPNLHEKTFRDASALGGLNPFQLRDRQHPRAMRLGAQGQGQGDREGDQDHALDGAARAPQRAADAHRRSRDAQGAGHRRRHRGHSERARSRQCRLRGRAGGEAADHRRPHDPAVGDLPDARLLAVHPVAEDGGGVEAPEDHADGRQRGEGGLRLRRQLQGQDSHQGAVRRSREVQDLRRLHAGLPDRRSQRIRRRADRAPRHPHPLRAGHPRQLLPRRGRLSRPQSGRVRQVQGRLRGRAPSTTTSSRRPSRSRWAPSSSPRASTSTARTRWPNTAAADTPTCSTASSSSGCARHPARPAGTCLRPSDHKEPKNVVFIQCSGSRDPEQHCAYCSKICCMYTAKHATLYKHHVPDGNAYVFYIDIRSGGKGYEEFVQRAMERDGVDLSARPRFQGLPVEGQAQGAGRRYALGQERRDRRRHGGAGPGHGAVQGYGRHRQDAEDRPRQGWLPRRGASQAAAGGKRYRRHLPDRRRARRRRTSRKRSARRAPRRPRSSSCCPSPSWSTARPWPRCANRIAPAARCASTPARSRPSAWWTARRTSTRCCAKAAALAREPVCARPST